MHKENRFSHRTTNQTGNKVLGLFLKAGAFFVIFEPIWMLLPFAGFLYGSVMHIKALSRNPYTAKLVYFVFPTHTLFPLGLILILTGIVIFLVGAFQIYTGKLSKKGLIQTGIYRRLRHPQYLALTIFGIGIILTWGRLITFITFFIMLWLYFFLARGEEKNCLELFGNEYKEYRQRTCLLFPGEKIFTRIWSHIPLPDMSSWFGVLVSFLLVVGLSSSIGLLIIKVKSDFKKNLPVISGHYQPDVPFLMVRGPALQAAPSEKVRDRFMADSFEMLLSSPAINKTINNLELNDNTMLLAFLTPGDNWFGGAHRDFRKAQVNVLIFTIKSSIVYNGNNFRELRRDWEITHMIRAQKASYDRLVSGLDPVAGEIKVEPYDPRMEERIDFLLSGL